MFYYFNALMFNAPGCRYNLRTRALLWDLHLDLTTDLTKFRAFMCRPPHINHRSLCLVYTH